MKFPLGRSKFIDPFTTFYLVLVFLLGGAGNAFCQSDGEWVDLGSAQESCRSDGEEGEWVDLSRVREKELQKEIREVTLNLQTFSLLTSAPTGSKLRVGEDGAWNIVGPGYLPMRALRWRDSLINQGDGEEDFTFPLKGLLNKAYHLHRQRKKDVPITLVAAALRGLKTLRTTYADRPKKLIQVNEILKWAFDHWPYPGLFPSSPAPSLKAVREKYKKHLLYPLSQGEFLMKERNGICLAMTLDWIRRKNKGRNSRAVIPSSILPQEEQERMFHKMPGLVSLQDKIDECIVVGGSDRMHKVVRHVLKTHGEGKFDGLEWYEVGGFFLPLCDQVEGDVLFRAVLEQIKKHGRDLVVILKGKVDLENHKVAEGHALGLSRDERDGSIHFFDPNIGEFLFAGEEDFLSFIKDLYGQIYRGEFRGISLMSSGS